MKFWKDQNTSNVPHSEISSHVDTPIIKPLSQTLSLGSSLDLNFPAQSLIYDCGKYARDSMDGWTGDETGVGPG